MQVHKSEFEKWLRLGLGRAVVFLKQKSNQQVSNQEDGSPYREAILYACLHDQRYDRQIEETRGAYLYDVVQASGEPDYFRDRIIEALFRFADGFLAMQTEGEEPYQWMEFIRNFAAKGDSIARTTLSSVFQQNAQRQDYRGAGELIALDGIAGFQKVVSTYLNTIGEDEDLDEILYWIFDLEEHEGDEDAHQQLHALGQQDPQIGKRLAAVAEQRATLRKTDGRPTTPLAYAEILELIDTDVTRMRAKGMEPRGLRFRGIGKNRASPEALKQFATDIDRLAYDTRQQQRDRLIGMLRLFGLVPFPNAPAPLIALAANADNDVRFAALQAMENVKHPDVRAFALAAFRQRRSDTYGNAVDMLTTNFEGGDFTRVERLLTEEMEEMDEFDYHSLCMGVKLMAEEHLLPEAIPALTLLYENGLCGCCRRGCVELLYKLGAVTEAMHAECRYDAYPSTRAWANETRIRKSAYLT